MLLNILILFLFTFFTLFCLRIIFRTYKNHAKFNIPPGPKGLPFIGNIHQFDVSATHIYFSNLAKIYGPILSLRLGTKRVVVIQSASLAKEVLKTQDTNFCSRPSLVAHQRLSYGGSDLAFSRYDEYYKEKRKLCVVHMFNSKKVESFAPIICEEVSRMMQILGSLSCVSESFNLSSLFMTLTSSVICRNAFGKRYSTDGVENRRFQYLLHEAQTMLASFFFEDYFPLFGGLLDKLTGKSSKLERVFNDLDQFYDQIINDVGHTNKPESENLDFINILLHLQKEPSFSFQFTMIHIKAILMNIIIAGTDTNAAMMVWAMTELIKNPTTMRKVQDELRNLNKDKNLIEEDDLPKLKYLKATIKETFRLHPPSPLLVVREALQKCTVQGYDILPETLVFLNVWVIGRDPRLWKDPETFMPERFMDSSIDFRGQDFELIPFGGGRRVCPGILLSVASFEVTLANMLYAFDWELPIGLKKEDIDTDVIPGITMHKKNALCLRVNKFRSISGCQ